MPPIPIYTKSPINAAKADGVTPQTAEASENKVEKQQPPTTTATSAQQQSGGYPAAQPGAVPPLPAVTPAPATSQQYAPIQPTPTTSLGYQGPPPPQPGAAPVAPGAASQTPASAPPPATGTQPARLPGQGPPPATSTYPPQMSVPPPTVAHAQRGTSSTAFAVPYGAGQADPSHPPGYQQNINADQFTSSQREGYHTAMHSSSGWGAGGEGGGGGDGGEGEEGVWGAARKWAQAAGDKLSAAESEVWRRINKKE
ncbi:hypothetical protein NKR19_g2196 [Coniochaeta hoffmannii]|uniref:Uncharacterized protein n=1 Tax=Coniochaeta hoffmannii TaxID=91930 RepID=A0AA38W2K6_9PEZI|nr:hypothetical protein NKR19_g2196 [Coniochaeta hoffmannii]